MGPGSSPQAAVPQMFGANRVEQLSSKKGFSPQGGVGKFQGRRGKFPESLWASSWNMGCGKSLWEGIWEVD